jgi:hypothetical protein
LKGDFCSALQRAHLNFRVIQPMAAFSVACYILQIKDRHNEDISNAGILKQPMKEDDWEIKECHFVVHRCPVISTAPRRSSEAV